MLSMRRWERERILTAHSDGTCEVLAPATLTPRLPVRVRRPVLGRMLGVFFSHRHRRLVARFGRAG